jgi:hypothetical protein
VLFTFFQLLLALAICLSAILVVSGSQIHWSAVLLIPLLVLHLLFFPDVIHLTDVEVVLRSAPARRTSEEARGSGVRSVILRPTSSALSAATRSASLRFSPSPTRRIFSRTSGAGKL